MGLFRRAVFPGVAVAFLLVSCGGGGGGGGDGGAAVLCDIESQKRWLSGYMNEGTDLQPAGDDRWYLWTQSSPRPDPRDPANSSVPSYLAALRFKGDAVVPADRWSYIESAAQYSQFFGEGKTLGYGVSINGLEQSLPLKVRYVESQSPAAAAGVLRGDEIVSANGRSADQILADNTFADFSAQNPGDTLTLVVTREGATRTLVLQAAVFPLTPVSAPQVFQRDGGVKVGYVVLKDFISQSEAPLAQALTDMRAQGATELVVDLRYNGGGLVSTATKLASLITGDAHGGEVFTKIRYNAWHPGSNRVFSLGQETGAKFQRVVVLTGPRTCSASELVVNGLKPYVQVVTIGGTTCGKPVGFSPRQVCGNVYSVVNFDSVNAQDAGGYYNGIAPSCTVKDDFNLALGDRNEALTAAALSYLGTGACPAATLTTPGTARISSSPPNSSRFKQVTEPGERNGMWVD